MRDPEKHGKPGPGRRLAVLRASLGLDQKDVAQRARVFPGAVSEIEQDKRNPEPETLGRLLEALQGLPANVQRADWLIRAVAGDAVESRAIEGLGFAVEDQARTRIARRPAPDRPADRRDARHDWDDLRSFEVEELRAIIEDCPELQTPAFCAVLCEESEKLARSDARRAAGLAELALDLAGWLPRAGEA